jgi:iron complex transport system substrate-binding protein
MKKIIVLLVIVTMAVLISGCEEIKIEDEMITIVDMVGDEVTLKTNPQKVAVIARAAADMMIGFGLGDVVDGMFQTVLDNSWTKVIYPDVENFYTYAYNESAELFLSRGIDLVLAPERHIAQALRENGVTAITVSLYGNPRYDVVMYKIADLISEIWPRTAPKVNMWKTELDTAINTVKSVLETKEIAPLSIYYVRGDRDRGIGYTDTIGSLVETIYEDVFGLTYLGSQFASNRPSIEDIMLKNPNIIVVGGAFQNKIISDIFNFEPQKFIDAVVNQRVFNIPIGFVMWEQNSMALPLFIYDQANKLYPDYFDFDIARLTRENFERYFNIELTNQQILFMLNGKSPTGSFLAL